jgi:hypothetical protein
MAIRDAKLVEEARHACREDCRERIDLGGQGRGVPETGKVDGEDVEVLGESGDHRLPGVACGSDTVQQYQRRAGAAV